ncbi:DNA mismatch endonuclease Vsr [uncultured Alistipes sp.]|uniref:very short patch repair endonuclease n=2 Tax=uncultured Alistipes sp. TaxID=538949 RepID=UPI0027D93AAF|nr:DNA mismatch endonuclease Vsr [uncultured Alistipes sp.]
MKGNILFMDIWDKEGRSKMMSKIRSTNTKPEIKLRKFLFSEGFRYRINDKKLPGKPDIVLAKYKTVIFVHGCFWHEHKGCRRSHIPKSNEQYWIDKIAGNVKRDKARIKELQDSGWNVLIAWECEINNKGKFEALKISILQQIINPAVK